MFVLFFLKDKKNLQYIVLLQISFGLLSANDNSDIVSHVVAVEVGEVEVVCDRVEQRVGLDDHPGVAERGRVRQVAVLIETGGEEQACKWEYMQIARNLNKSQIDFPVCILS